MTTYHSIFLKPVMNDPLSRSEAFRYCRPWPKLSQAILWKKRVNSFQETDVQAMIEKWCYI